MAVEVIEKKKRGLTCAECSTSIEKSATECPECGSKNIKKSLVVVRKSVADTEDELPDTDGVEEDDDLEEEEDESEEEEEEEDNDDDEDDEDEEDEEDEDDEEDEEPSVKKSAHPLVGLEALNISTALAEDIAKVFNGKPSRKKYETVMTELNNVMDAAADRWFAGQSVSKSKKKAPHVTVIQGRVNGIIKNTEGTTKMARPKNFDSLDPATKKYIEELEGGNGDVAKSISKRADLPEDVRKSLEAADRIVEENENNKWLTVAKGYSHIPGNEVEDLAKSLRSLSESNPEAYEVLKKSLDAAEENLASSEIFKSFGRPGGGGTQETEISKRAAELVEKGEFATIEQAEVSLMGSDNYTPTA